MKNITIIGAGAFGFAICKHLSDKIKNNDEIHKEDHHNECKIKLFDVNEEIIEHIKNDKTQKYFFPEIPLNDNVIPTTNLEFAVKDADVLIIAIPTQFLRGFLTKAKEFAKENLIILNCSKGIELSSKKLISEIVSEEFSTINFNFAALSGGMIASEFISGFGIFGAEIASKDKKTGVYLQKLFSSKKLRIYLNNDIMGVEAAGALKNVISIASGIVDGLRYPYGSKTFIVSLGGKEIKEVSMRLGSKEHTFNLYTQAFGNDYLMSTTGNTRNRYLGELIGKGMTGSEAIEQMKKEKKTAEGYYTTQALFEIAREHNLNTPIIDMVYNILYNNFDPKECIESIMKNELEHIEGCIF